MKAKSLSALLILALLLALCAGCTIHINPSAGITTNDSFHYSTYDNAADYTAGRFTYQAEDIRAVVFIGSRAASILSKRILLSFLSVIQRMTVRRRPSFILCCGMASLPSITAPRITAVRCSPNGSSSPSRSPAVSN